MLRGIYILSLDCCVDLQDNCGSSVYTFYFNGEKCFAETSVLLKADGEWILWSPVKHNQTHTCNFTVPWKAGKAETEVRFSASSEVCSRETTGPTLFYCAC